jgi:hypothetical protein
MRKVILLAVTILLLSLVLALPVFADPVGSCPANFTLIERDDTVLPHSNGDSYLCIYPPPFPEEDPNERDALIALFNSTNGPGWINKAGWNTVDPHCTWFGVSCFENSVIELDLNGNQLSGPIPPELGNLSNLRWLSLSDNQLGGPIPAALSNLSKLYELGLFNNPDLKCWQTEAALNWAQSLMVYDGPDAVCPFVCLPVLLSDGS